MPALTAVLFVAIFWWLAAMSGDWLRHQAEQAEVNQLINSVEAVIEAAYMYRGDHHRWPVGSAELCAVFPNSSTCRSLFASSSHANPFSVVVSAKDTLQLSVQSLSNLDLAKRLSRSLGKQSSVIPDPAINPNASEYLVRFDIALPSRLSLLEETLLTDGSNAMHKPLFFATTAAAGDSCTKQALVVDPNGDLLRCVSGFWTF